MLLACGLPAPAALVDPWAEVQGPWPGDPWVVGEYAGGCIRGAVAVPADETAFQLMRPSRGR